MDSSKQQKQQKPYRKPKVRIVDLAAKEVLGVGCKNDGGVGAANTMPPCMNNGCQEDGS